MLGIDIQELTLIEAAVLLATNVLGAALTALAWRVSDVDVSYARAWHPPTADPVEAIRLRHNRLVVTEDARHGEQGRFLTHLLIAVIGLFWLLTPQPTNPGVIWWAVAIRCVAILASLVLIEKTTHHLIARWRFDRPDSASGRISDLWPALALAWRDMRSVKPWSART